MGEFLELARRNHTAGRVRPDPLPATARPASSPHPELDRAVSILPKPPSWRGAALSRYWLGDGAGGSMAEQNSEDREEVAPKLR